MQLIVFEKNWSNSMLVPPQGASGKSWIRHWKILLSSVRKKNEIATVEILSETNKFTSIHHFYQQRFYVATSRQLKRIDSVKRSPIYAHFSETISGVSTIRAYNRVEAFVEKSDVLIDGNNMAYYPSVVSNRFDGQLDILYLYSL